MTFLNIRWKPCRGAACPSSTRSASTGRAAISRHGIMMMELLAATGFLALACGIAVKVHRSRLDYDRMAMDRLRSQLAVENEVQRLRAVPYEDLREMVEARSESDQIGIAIDTFTSGETNGLHLVVHSKSKDLHWKQHLWRLENAP